MRSIFISPHYYSASVIAKMTVIWSTAMWAFVVLIKHDALIQARFPLYAQMTEYVPENIWAASAFGFSVIAFYRLWVHAAPRWWGSILYGWFMCFWLYITFGILTTPEIIMPALTGAITAIASLSVYAFIVNPKPNNGMTGCRNVISE